MNEKLGAIKMSGIKFNMDEEGNTKTVLVTYNKFETEEYLNAQVLITPDDMEEGTELDDLRKNDFDEIAKNKIKGWLD